MVDDINEEYPEQPEEPQEQPEEPREQPQEVPQEQPQQPVQQPKKKSNGLSTAIFTMAILIGGMFAVMKILDYYLENYAETLNVDVSMIASLTDLGYLFIYVMGAILAILIVIYIITKIRKPTKSL
ncbi:MAG: hypothetical protein GOV02_00800 [Candidatus Aenigmarchaeota archaeon]|nr:hypothetical protein [Candidatus Aenigmarchaeota archaeon]